MKEKINQMFKDKLFLVMLVLGLLTLVAAAGVVTIQRGSGKQENPYVEMQGQDGFFAEDLGEESLIAGESNALAENPQETNEGMELASEQETISSAEGSQTADEGAAAGTQLAEENASGDGISGENPADFYEAEAAGMDAAKALVLDFSDTAKMMWPVRGNVVLDYSMDSTIYFPTLDQYKCNPGLVIQSEVSAPVYAPANARVLEVGMNEEIGNYLTLDLGNGYTTVCGQLKEIAAAAGEYLEQGQLLGYVAEPTKYYTVEGSNVFLELKRDDKVVDPLDYME